MSSNIGFHIFLILWPHIAHSSGNMLLKVLQCCRFSIIMNLNGNLLPENCIADSSFPLSMDVNVVNCQLVYFWQECGKKDDGENLCRPYFHSVCQGTYHLHLSKKLFTMIISIRIIISIIRTPDPRLSTGLRAFPNVPPGWAGWLATRVGSTTTGQLNFIKVWLLGLTVANCRFESCYTWFFMHHPDDWWC